MKISFFLRLSFFLITFSSIEIDCLIFFFSTRLADTHFLATGGPCQCLSLDGRRHCVRHGAERGSQLLTDYHRKK